MGYLHKWWWHLRILWYSNAPWAPTGYGGQTKLMLRKFAADGHQVAVANNFGVAGTTIDYDGVPIYPVGDESYSNDIIPAHYGHWSRGEPTQLLTLYDLWPLMPKVFAEIPNNAAWVPIDHSPVPEETIVYLKVTGAMPIAMSRFGEEQLRLAKFEPRYVPHAIDLDVFRPTERLVAGPTPREWWGIDADRFVVTISANNKGRAPARKAFAEMFSAVGHFMRQRPDVFLYVHADPSAPDGLDLVLLAIATGIPASRMAFPDRYAYHTGAMSPADLAAIYTASDVLLATSRGEGFGIPVIEAQACGTPVIVGGGTAQPELVGAGWIVDGQPEWDPAHKAWFFLPFIHSIADRLEVAYQTRGQHREAAMAKAAEYDIETVYPTHWRPILAELAEGLTAKRAEKSGLVIPLNREQRRAKRR